MAAGLFLMGFDMKRFERKKRRGVAIIEFAFWLPMVMIMLSGLLDFGWYMANSQNVLQAARDGARQGAATRDDPETAGNEVVSQATAGANWIHTASALPCDAVDVVQFEEGGLDAITVRVKCDFIPLLGVYPKGFGRSAAGGFLPDYIYHEFTMYAEVQ